MPRELGTPLYPIVDVDAASSRGLDPLALASAWLRGGASVLQIRAKKATGAELLAVCERVVECAHAVGARVIVNDRVDIAKMARADGVHLGQLDLEPSAARVLLGPQALIGWSTHTRGQIDEAVRLPIDYLAVGPVFATSTKDTGYAAVGLDLVRYASARFAGRDVVGIGGITLERARAVQAAGAAAVAVISDLMHAEDASRRVGDYLRVLRHHV